MLKSREKIIHRDLFVHQHSLRESLTFHTVDAEKLVKVLASKNVVIVLVEKGAEKKKRRNDPQNHKPISRKRLKILFFLGLSPK